MKENSGERFAEQQNMKKVWDQIIHFDKQSLRRRLPGSGSQGSSFWLLVAGCSRSDCRRSAAGSEWNGGETASSCRSGLGRIVPQWGCLCRVCIRG